MKSILFLILLCSSLIGTNQLFAQIYQSDNGLITSGTGTSTKVSLGGSLTGNTTLNLGGNNLTLNGTTGNLGIRTASPFAPLHVYKNLSSNYNPVAFLEDDLADGYVMLGFMGTGRQYHIGAGNASEAYFGVPNKFFLWDQQAQSMRMVLDTDGNFGFGTTSPGNRVTVNSATANTSGLQLMQLNSGSPAVTGNGKVLSVDGTGNVILVNGGGGTGGAWSTSGNSGVGSGFLGTTDASPLIFKVENIEQMRLNGTGLVLGTPATPLLARLDVDGIARFNSHLQVNNFAFTKGINIPEFVELHQGIRTDNAEISTVHFQSSFWGGLESNWIFEGAFLNNRDFFNDASIVRIRHGWGSPSNSSGKQVATLLVDPPINNISNYTYTARGIYYKPQLDNLNGVTHIAIENTYGQNRFNSLGGNTLIGTSTDNGDKLQVNGRVYATGLWIPTGAIPGYVLMSDFNGVASWQPGQMSLTKVKVDPGVWPDYVFEERYPVMSLPQLEAFIRQHGHLPEVPSAEEVEKEGFDLVKNQAVLLKKIEELSLHLIEQGKRLKEQQEKIVVLEKALEDRR